MDYKSNRLKFSTIVPSTSYLLAISKIVDIWRVGYPCRTHGLPNAWLLYSSWWKWAKPIALNQYLRITWPRPKWRIYGIDSRILFENNCECCSVDVSQSVAKWSSILFWVINLILNFRWDYQIDCRCWCGLVLIYRQMASVSNRLRTAKLILKKKQHCFGLLGQVSAFVTK